MMCDSFYFDQLGLSVLMNCVLGGRHLYGDDERCRSRGRYADGRHTQGDFHYQFPSPPSLTIGMSMSFDYQLLLRFPELAYQGLHSLGDSKRNHSLRDHGESVQHHFSPRVKPPSPMPTEISPWDDGYESPTSPTYSTT